MKITKIMTHKWIHFQIINEKLRFYDSFFGVRKNPDFISNSVYYTRFDFSQRTWGIFEPSSYTHLLIFFASNIKGLHEIVGSKNHHEIVLDVKIQQKAFGFREVQWLFNQTLETRRLNHFFFHQNDVFIMNSDVNAFFREFID